MTRPSLALIALLLAIPAPADGGVRVTLQGNGTDLGETPLVVDAPEGLSPGPYVLQDEAARLPAQVVLDRNRPILGLILDRLGADQTRRFNLIPAEPEPSPVVHLEAHGLDVRILLRGNLVTNYVASDGPKPYLFPLIGPTGARMTRAFPMEDVPGEDRDHPHQRSFWFTHGDVNGIDFWSEEPGHGSIRQSDRPTLAEGPALGLIRTVNDWLGPDGKKVCQDERVLRVYAMKGARILDLEVTILASEGPVKFGDTKEGTLGLRVPSSMNVNRRKGGRIINAEGVADGDAWGRSSPWVDYSGPVGGTTVGVAILNHPDSLRHPTTWHVRDYGLFAANPFGYRDFGQKESGDLTLPAGESIRFLYRIILHQGDAASAGLPAAFAAYAHPPKVVVQTEDEAPPR